MTTTTTIATFPTRKETERSTAGFADIHVYERYYQDRLRCENMVCRNLDKSLNGIPGRSAARTKLEKINFLMAQDFTIGVDGIVYERNDPRAAAAVTPIAPVETEDDRDNATLMEIDPKVATKHYPLLQWLECKKTDPRAIVMVEDQDDNRCWITFAGDAAIASRLLHLMKNDVWFGDQGFEMVRIGKGAFSAFSSRLKDKGYRVISPLT
jgi:hypothetical protein